MPIQPTTSSTPPDTSEFDALVEAEEKRAIQRAQDMLTEQAQDLGTRDALDILRGAKGSGLPAQPRPASAGAEALRQVNLR